MSDIDSTYQLTTAYEPGHKAGWNAAFRSMKDYYAEEMKKFIQGFSYAPAIKEEMGEGYLGVDSLEVEE
jgi:hypothetical protein